MHWKDNRFTKKNKATYTDKTLLRKGYLITIYETEVSILTLNKQTLLLSSHVRKCSANVFKRADELVLTWIGKYIKDLNRFTVVTVGSMLKSPTLKTI